METQKEEKSMGIKDKTKEELEKRANELNSNASLWDDGSLGESEDHAIVSLKKDANKPTQKPIRINPKDWDRIMSEPAGELSEECAEIQEDAEEFFRAKGL